VLSGTIAVFGCGDVDLPGVCVSFYMLGRQEAAVTSHGVGKHWGAKVQKIIAACCNVFSDNY
jgi:hypothetical protein